MRLGESIVIVLIVANAAALASESPASFASPPASPLEGRRDDGDEGRGSLAPFVTDTALTLHLRSFYFDGTQNGGTESEAWAGGGWLSYQSGWLLDAFAIGATIYGSAPLYAPVDKDGTLLLGPGQKGYYALGEAWGALRYRDYAVLKGYRQPIDQGYVNPSDIRMTPYTFEGATVGGKVDVVEYLAGYLWKIKARNAETFISIAAQAGAMGSNGGLALVGVQLRAWAGLIIDVSDQYGIDTFNTVYAKADFRHSLSDDWDIGLATEFTDQRAVGAALVGNAATKKWNTQVGGARVQLIYRPLTLTAAFSITASGNDIQNPWGTYPGFLALIDAPASQNFARAREKGWLIGARYDFSALGVPGLAGNFNFARGTGAIDPQTQVSVPNQNEFNFKGDYRPPWLAATVLRGLWVTVRASLYLQEGADQLGRQIHLILNWEWEILAPKSPVSISSAR